MSSTLRRLQPQDDPRPRRRPMIPYDDGLPSLPDDIISEIFSLLDVNSLKSCSLTGKALSCSTKPFIHQTLYLIPRCDESTSFAISNGWYIFQGLQFLGERGLLRYTRHLFVNFPYDPHSRFTHSLDPCIQYLHTIKNLKSLRTCWLDIPSFIPKVEGFWGAFFGSLQSLELIFPTGDHEQILRFICQFPNLRDLKVDINHGRTNTVRNDGPRIGNKTSPPLDGTLDLQFGTSVGIEGDPAGIQFIPMNLVRLPSGLKFRTLKLSWCIGDNLQPLVDACAPTLECIEFIGQWSDAVPRPRLSFEQHSAFRRLELKLELDVDTESFTRWLAATLSTITSDVFTELTVYFPPVYTASEDQVSGWNSVDDVLDQRILCEDVTLVVGSLHRVRESDAFKDLIRICFPLMWKNGKVVLKGG